MAVYQDIKLDINHINSFSYINTKQGDSGRTLNIQLTINDQPYKIPINAYAIFRAIKPDDTFVYNQGTVNSDGTCTVQLTEQVLAVYGKVYCDISIILNKSTVSSASFVIFNDIFPRSSSSISSSSQYTALNNFVTYLNNYSSKLDNLANGTGITVALNDDILTVTKTT